MWSWLGTRRGAATPRVEVEARGDDGRLALEREAQGLRLELQERDRDLARLRQELQRQQAGERDRTASAVRSQLERLVGAAATAATQLHTQGHRLEVDGRPVAARDILAGARRLIRVLEDEGMTLDGAVDQDVPFNPERHETLRDGVPPPPGRPVVIQLAGVSFRGKVLRKAGVVEKGD